jgi:hypothetical protein
MTKSTIIIKGCLKPYFYEKHFVRKNVSDITSYGNYLTSLENPKTDSFGCICCHNASIILKYKMTSTYLGSLGKAISIDYICSHIAQGAKASIALEE